MLASRLLSILLLLQTRGRASASELAEAFEVSVRTIHRDIDQLGAAGIPVYAERGRSGGFRLLDGYRTRLTGLTQLEAEALFLAGLPGPAAQLGLSELLSAARLKLLAALPASMQPGAERIASRFHLDAAGWFRGEEAPACLQTVARAVWDARWLTLSYRSDGKVYPRKLAPLGLVLKGGSWYLVAASGNAVRTYRVANIADAAIDEKQVVPPAKFDLAVYWEKSARDYEAGLYREHADVRLSPAGMARLSLLGPHVAETARKTASLPDREGRMRCRLPIEAGDYGMREMLRLGDELEVLGPPELRKRIAASLTAMLQRHEAA